MVHRRFQHARLAAQLPLTAKNFELVKPSRFHKGRGGSPSRPTVKYLSPRSNQSGSIRIVFSFERANAYVAIPSADALSPCRSIGSKAVHGLDACCICATPQSAFMPSTRVSTEQPQTRKFMHASAPHATLPLVTTVRTSFELRAKNAPATTSHPRG